MKYSILSGGSGNEAIVNGLMLHGNCSSYDIRIITNAYDNGKSTGICRSVTNTLGVSDIRKNHYRIYRNTYRKDDDVFYKFYVSRYSISSVKDIYNILDLCGLSFLGDYAERFMLRPSTQKLNLDDFNISNIIYSEMYSDLGYSYTNRIFCDILGIDDCVVLNSYDNVYLNAITSKLRLIDDEGSIVEYCCSEDPIKDICFSGKDNYNFTLNDRAIKEINSSDVLILSTGTFWSSIYPTIVYGDFYKYINSFKGKKIWFINSKEDKDSYGVTSNDFISILSSVLNLSDFIIVENLSAVDSLKEKSNRSNLDIRYFDLGNSDGVNDDERCFLAINNIVNEV